MSLPANNQRPDALLLALRPAVAAAATDADGTVGHFLHTTLRPVLKLQNPLLLALVADFVHDHHVVLRPTDTAQQLTDLLGRNTKLRAIIVGLVSGQFTATEYGFYQIHRAELNRRLLELALHRVLDQA